MVFGIVIIKKIKKFIQRQKKIKIIIKIIIIIFEKKLIGIQMDRISNYYFDNRYVNSPNIDIKIN